MLIASLGPVALMGGERHYPIEIHFESRSLGDDPDGNTAYQSGFYTEFRDGNHARSMLDLGPEPRLADATSVIALAARGHYEAFHDDVYASYGVHSVPGTFRLIYGGCQGQRWQLHTDLDTIRQHEGYVAAGRQLVGTGR